MHFIKNLYNYYIFLFSFIQSILCIVILKYLSHKYRILLDYPDNILKKHNQPVSMIGGTVIIFVLSTIYMLHYTSNYIFDTIIRVTIIIYLMGLIDDIFRIKYYTKFLFQIIVFVILIKTDIFIKISILPLYINYLFTFIWIIFIINAFNLLDIYDGLLGFVTTQVLIGFILYSYLTTNYEVGYISLILLGVLCGYIIFNYFLGLNHRIYTGDSGSMLIGLIVAVLSFKLDYTSHNNFGVFIPATILFVPIFDLIYVIILRLLKGKNIFKGSDDHLVLILDKTRKNRFIPIGYALTGILILSSGYPFLYLKSNFSIYYLAILFLITIIVFVKLIIRGYYTNTNNCVDTISRKE